MEYNGVQVGIGGAKCLILWSGRRDSNPRRPAWEAGILPLNYSRFWSLPSRTNAVYHIFAYLEKAAWRRFQYEGFGRSGIRVRQQETMPGRAKASIVLQS